MTDMREPEPDERTLDLREDSHGGRQWGAMIEVWPYSSLRNEKVYTRRLTVLFRAEDARRAHGFAQAISATISLAHDVFQTNINKLWQIQ